MLYSNRRLGSVSLVNPSFMRILVIEDDIETADYVIAGLHRSGHLAQHVSDGREGIICAAGGNFDAIVVDRMLPETDGLTVVKTLRSIGVKAGIIFLTARAGVDDRVEGLDAGGDDYLVKPFAFSELLARVNALARRPPVQDQKTILRTAGLELDLIKRTVMREGMRIDLQPREFALLEVLMRNEGRVMTRTMLLERVWDIHFDPKTSVVETHISRLRAKVDRPFAVQLLHTIRNTGYSLHAPR